MISITAPNNISYKDTAARVVNIEGVYYRYIFNEYKAEYDCLMQSGLYEALIVIQKVIYSIIVLQNFITREISSQVPNSHQHQVQASPQTPISMMQMDDS
jgi:hypothetical protein